MEFKYGAGMFYADKDMCEAESGAAPYDRSSCSMSQTFGNMNESLGM